MTSNRLALLAGTLSLILVAAPVVFAAEKTAEETKKVDAPKTISLHHPGYVFELPEGFLGADSPMQIFGEDVGGGFRVNINTLVQSLPAPMELQAFTDLSKKQLGSQGKILSEGALELGGFPGGFVVVELPGEGGQMLKAKTAYTVTGTKAFIMTYTATKETYEKYLPAADKAFATFKLR